MLRSPTDNWISPAARSQAGPDGPLKGCMLRAPVLIIAVLGTFGFSFRTCDATDDHVSRGSDFRNPDAVRSVLNGQTRVANAAWWGFDRVDATHAIQGAINSGARTVVIPYMGADWIVRPLTLASNQDIMFEPGVVVMAKRGEFHGKQDSLFQGIGVHDVILRGYGAVLRMRKADYRGQGYTKSEHRHVLTLKGASNITVEGLTLENSGGDGIYLGPTWDDRRIPCRNVRIQDCTCRDNHRQGISVVSAETVRIENCTLANTRGTAPQAGLDLEPSHPDDLLADVEVTNCVADGNAGTGFMVNLSRLNGKSREVHVRFEDCLVTGSRQPGLRVLLRNDDSPLGLVEFRNCTCEKVDYSGALCVWHAASSIKLRFVNCKWRDVARRTAEAPIHIQMKKRKTRLESGGLEFVNCYVYDNIKRPALRIVDKEPSEGDYNIRGEINVINPTGGIDPLVIERLPHLKMSHHK